jgi:hypothetical protein
MPLKRFVFVPNTSQGRDRRMVFISTLITLGGILFFNWQVAQVIFMFFWEMIFLGMATVLRMIFAMNGLSNYLQDLLPRLFWTVGFSVLYGGMIMLLVAFVISGLDIESLFDDFTGFRYGIWMLGLNHLAAFLFGFLLNKQFKQTSFVRELFATMFIALPTVVLMVVIVAPNSHVMGEAYRNVWMAAAIVLIRFLMDLFAVRLQKLFFPLAEINEE